MPCEIGLKPGEVSFAGNDYLGLARDPRLAEALHRGALAHGISSTSSRWALGWTEVHAALERELAAFFGVEDACLLGAAYFGGSVYFEVARTYAGTVICDETVHANQFLGMRAAGFTVQTFRHVDLEDLARKLGEHRGTPPIVAADGVYGISGERAPLKEIHALARQHSAELFVDDAHGVFALGAHGRGTPEACGLEPGACILLGSMSKALGCNGGFLAGPAERVERYRRAVPTSGSSVTPAPIAAAALEGLRIVRAEPERRAKMWAHAERMRAVLAERGIGVVSTESPIVAMTLRGEAEARALDAHFRTRGLVIPYFKYASEPRQNLLRSVARATYSEAELRTFEAAVRSWERK